MSLRTTTPISLKHYLLSWVVGVLWAVWAVLLLAVWHTAKHEAEEITDGQLISVARLWLLTDPQITREPAALNVPERIREYVQDIAVVRIIDDRVVNETHKLSFDWVTKQQLGFFDVELLTDQAPQVWRVYQTQQITGNGLQRLLVLMNTDHRDDLAWDMTRQMLAPIWVLFPLSFLLLVLAVTQATKPLKRLINDIDVLDGKLNERLLSQPPFREFQKAVISINGLLQKLNAQRAHERAFTSDVAHELRTPLASIALQSHMLSAKYSPEIAQELEAQALKAGTVLTQLLVLARTESARPRPSENLRLDELLPRIKPNLDKLAKQYSKQLTCQQDLSAPVSVHAEPVAVELVIQNLVDNALRHTPPSSRVEVRLRGRGDWVSIEVEDWPVPDQSIEGSQPGLGLGLQLVQRLLTSQGGKLIVEHKSTGGRLAQALWPTAAHVS
jgi:two-component system, OmpR family, sensor histidine kinase QseC